MQADEHKIQTAYKASKQVYDDILTADGFWWRFYNKLAWGVQDKEYVEALLTFISDDFAGNMLDIPVGTGVFTADKYLRMQKAVITAVDYSVDMLEQAERRFHALGIKHAVCRQGDVGNLPFAAESFDLVLSMNGFHAFPDKEKAFSETARVLKTGGSFCGCLYIKGERKITDLVVNRILAPKGWFTPPFYSKGELQAKLAGLYDEVTIYNLKSMAYFRCRK